MSMKKNTQTIVGLNKVVNELGDVSQSKLNETLIDLGYNPDELSSAVRRKIEEVKRGNGATTALQSSKENFNPLLVAATGKAGIRKENALKKLKKRS